MRLVCAGVAALLLLAGCASKEERVSQEKLTGADGLEEAKPALKTDGKYYKDDGPPAFDEVDWRTVPDAEVAFAPINPRYNRPYEVFGIRYVPYTEYQQYRERGRASWYGRRYHGRKTSSSEVYDMYAMTAAHTVLPIPSYVRVTRIDDGRSIIVRVNDRGPFLNNRIIDLSYTAARKLGVVESGTAEVIVEAILPPSELVVEEKPVLKQVDNTDIAATQDEQEVAPESLPEQPVQGSSRNLAKSAGNYLQLGAFSDKGNAENFANDLFLPTNMTISITKVRLSDGLHRVVIGPYPDRGTAEVDLDLLHAVGLEALIKVLE